MRTLRKIRLHILFRLIIISFCFIFSSEGKAQFYNGSQLDFGKNRVQYREFLWQYYSFDDFDTYFYRNGQELAIYASEYAQDQLEIIENKLESSLDSKVQFLIFNNLSDLKQSNIGLINHQSYNTGGVTYIIGRKVFLYFDGTYTNFEKQVRAGIAEVILNEMMFGGSIGSQIKNTALYNMPDWYQKGLIAYMSEEWNTELDNKVKDGIQTGKFKKFNHLAGRDALLAGQSMWKFIADNFGKSAVPNIIHMTRVTRSVENGFLYVLGLSFKNLINEWITYYQNYYQEDTGVREMPYNALLKKYKKDRYYQQAKVSPDGIHIAYNTNEIGQYKLYLYNTARDKRKRLRKSGFRIDQKTDYTYPILTWHPTGKMLAYLVEKKGEIYLYFYNIEERKKSLVVLYNFEKIMDISYSSDGRKLVFSAVQKGQSDIYVYDISSGSHEQLTKDIYDDLQPRFIDNSKKIIFVSNRPGDTIHWDPRVSPSDIPVQYDIFLYNYSTRDPFLRRVTNTPLANEKYPMAYDDDHVTYLSDENGIYNRYLASFDSVIAFVDTTTHYRYFTKSFPVTNYSRNIIEHDFNPGSRKYTEIIYYDKQFKIFAGDVVLPQNLEPLALNNTTYMQSLVNELKREKMIKTQDKEAVPRVRKKTKRFSNVYQEDQKRFEEQDGIDINDYEFDRRSFITIAAGDTIMVRPGSDSADMFIPPKKRNYRVEYFMNELTTQIDFSYLNATYQPFTGGVSPIYLNPGFNALFKIGLTDLLEDHRIVGGVRLNIDFINNEYLLSYSNLKKRIDREMVFHRVTAENYGYFSIVRNHSYQFYYILRYPFSPILAIQATAKYSLDQAVFLATDQFNLRQKIEYRHWASIKGQLIYDNTRSLGLNLYKGTRYMFFAEYYERIDMRKQDMVVLGFDIRNYQKVSRTLIWANRLAGSTSFGNNKVIYYMGGVDNWLIPKFDQETPIDYTQHYAYQTLATNMRGFDQNIRNGNNFIVFNTELRWPIIRFFSNRPLKSDFLNNFQTVGFVDVGTAWTGTTPYSSENSLYTRTISNGSLLITVERQLDPWVGGFGFGLRSRLLGYFLRGDLAWGVDDGRIRKPIFYVSLSLDF
ncbi:MAG: hypothetical protein U9R60_11265 [Bacteroidota bacterium]|nr:hypothetical protein [Bacteroidota bacterium]